MLGIAGALLRCAPVAVGLPRGSHCGTSHALPRIEDRCNRDKLGATSAQQETRILQAKLVSDRRLFIKRKESADEARLRWQREGETDNSYHSSFYKRVSEQE